MKNPVVLFSITNLCRVLEEWIPKLHQAMKSCLEMTDGDDSGLKCFLSATAFEDVSYLAQMCFDCGVYGGEGLQSFEDVVRSKRTTTKTPLSGFPVEHNKSETNDVVILISDDTNEPKSNRESDQLASESIPTSHGDVRATKSNEGHLLSGGTNPSSLSTGEFSPPSIRLSVVKDENFDAETETNDVVILISDDTNEPKSNRESDQLASESIPTSHGDVRATKSNEGHLLSGGTNPSSLSTGEFSPPSIRLSVVKDENFDAETADEESGKNTEDTLGENAKRQTDKPLNRMLGDSNKSPQSSVDETVSAPTEMSQNAILSQDSSSGLQSLQSYERICVQCENGTTVFENNGEQVYDTNFDDETRSRFLSYHFWLMDVRRLRRALLMSKGERKKTWSTFMGCLSGE